MEQPLGNMQNNNLNTEFLTDSLKGLRARPKYLLSKYFYDERGDTLFQQIMETPEYYLSDCETQILSEQGPAIAQALDRKNEPFDLLELGPGDGRKSQYILQALLDQGSTFRYVPVDISENALTELKSRLQARFPTLEIRPRQVDYFQGLRTLNLGPLGRTAILWLGANMGNMSTEQALQFCLKLNGNLKKDDAILLGIDLMKDPNIILEAYSDKQGRTREFNLNLLRRMNREIGSDFNLAAFEHYASYDPQSGTCRSYLISLQEQAVRFESNATIHLEKNEAIRTEISQKYRKSDIEALASASAFTVTKYFDDPKGYFTDVLWTV